MTQAMPLLWILGLGVVGAIASRPAAAQPAAGGAAASPVEAAPAPPTYTAIDRREDNVTVAELSNGLTVIVQENRVAPVATVRCYVKNTGSAFEGRDLGAGLSHVLEHVVSGGSTSRRTEKEIENIIDRFGGATNAYTSTWLTAYYIDCPAREVNTAIDLIADAMQRVVFEPAEFERELKVVQQELADGEVNRQRVLWKMLQQCVYTVHPMRHPVIGYLDVLRATENQTIIDFYRERYIPNNQVFVVVGDVDTQAVLDEVARHYAGTPRGRETFVALADEPDQLSPREAVREMDGATYDLALAWPTVPLAHPDLYALDVAAYILTEGQSSRLVRRLVYDEQLALAVNSASYTPHFVRGYFAVFASATPEKWEAAEAEILAEVYRLRNEPVSPQELEKAKKQKAAELVFGQQTVQQAAEALGRSLLSAGDPLFDKAYVAGIQQVTAEDIQRVAQRYFAPQRLNRVVIAPPGGAPQAPDAAAAHAAGEVRRYTLDNGLRVLVKRHTNLPLVNLQAYVLAGSLVDTPETAGRSDLVGAMLDKGTADYTAVEIAELFDSIGGQFNTTAGRFTVYASATVLREDLPKAAEVFAQCVTRPTFPEDEFSKVQALALGAIAQRAANPQAEIFEFFYDQLPPGSPFHISRGGKKETVERLTAADLRDYHAQWFTPQNMVVTVFGDVEPEEALALVRQHFGDVAPREDFTPISFDRPNALPAPVEAHKQTGKPTGMVLLAYPAMSILDREDYAALTVLDAILSGYSYPGGWLHNELRGQGLVYYVHAFPVAGPAPGYFAVLSQTAPEQIGEVVARIRRNLQRARAGEIPKEEFDTAIEMVINLHAQENTTIGEQAQQAALNELYGLGYDYDRTFDDRIQAVTLEKVIAAANKYLSGNYVLVTSSPEAQPALQPSAASE